MKPLVNNSFGEVLEDLLQPHVVFCYLQAVEHNSAGGKKAGCGHGRAETWMSVSCHRACGLELSSVAKLIQVQWLCAAWIKVEQKYCPIQQQMKPPLTRAEAISK